MSRLGYGREIVEDDMDFANLYDRRHLVHEIEEFDAPPPFVVRPTTLPLFKVEPPRTASSFRGVCSSVRLAGHGAPRSAI